MTSPSREQGREPTDGERWAREEVLRLRGQRFSPRAIRAFLAESRRRSRRTRAERPAIARQARRWETAGAVATLAVAVRRPEPRVRFLAGALAWWGAVAAMLDWHLGMVESEAGSPRGLGPADALTMARAWSVPLVAADAHPALLAGAAATDVLDGVVARATVPTRAGRDLEGLVDAAVVLAALRRLHRDRRLAPAVAGIEVARVAGGVAYAVAATFGRAAPASPGVVRAGRAAAPVRVAGLVLAASGARRGGSLLLAAGTVGSLTRAVRARVNRDTGETR